MPTSLDPAFSRLGAPRITPVEWDALRAAFHRSMLAETPLASLAQNVDGCAWSDARGEETPCDYLDLPHALVLELLAERGHKPDRFDALADILRGTLAFDDSFGAMVEVAERAEAAADPVRRNLEKLGVPADLPLDLCELSPTTLAFCHGERIHTLAGLLDFSRGASRRVFVGGEFQALLNAVYQRDETALARFLPFRPRHRGVHLIEGLAHVLRRLPVERRMEIARLPSTCDPDMIARAVRLAGFFSAQLEELAARRAEGMPLDRYLVSLDDLSLEAAVAGLLSRLLPETSPTATSVVPVVSPPSTRPRWTGWWRRLGRRVVA